MKNAIENVQRGEYHLILSGGYGLRQREKMTIHFCSSKLSTTLDGGDTLKGDQLDYHLF